MGSSGWGADCKAEGTLGVRETPSLGHGYTGAHICENSVSVQFGLVHLIACNFVPQYNYYKGKNKIKK